MRLEDENKVVEKADEWAEEKDVVKRSSFNKKKLLKWWPVPVYIIFVIIVFLFIKSGDEDDLFKAHFKDGTKVVTIGDTEYTVISKEDDGTYIGSYVSDKLNAVKKDKIASLRSYILYVSVFFSIEGDPEFNYVMDGKNSIYVKSSLYDEAKKYFDDEKNITSYKMTSKMKSYDTMNAISNEDVELLQNLKGEEINIKDPLLTENFETRREIYGFYDDGLFYKAEMELFLYNDEIYKTVWFVDKKDNKGTTVIKGIKLPEELQSKYKEIWN